MNKYIVKLTIFLLIGNSAFSQTFFRNEGNMNISGGFLFIQGSYQNENTADISLDGTIKLTGNWINNASNSVMSTTNGIGTVLFAGSGLQTIGGSSTNFFNFEGITIAPAASVEVSAGMGVSAAGACDFTSNPLILRSTTTAFRPITATFINNSTVTGNITMELSYTGNGSSATGGRALYFSSPINNANSSIFGANGSSNRLFYQDEINRKYVEIKTPTALTVAKGYFFRSTISPTVYAFTGPPNADPSYTTSNIPMADTGHYYLMGNPYPASIDWHTITRSNLKSTIWYRSCTPTGEMRIDTYNDSNGHGTDNNLTAAVDGKIPPMQGFWIQDLSVPGPGSITISASDRSHNWGSSAFLKSESVTTQDDVFRMYLYHNENRDEMMIIQDESAQDTFDDWDSRKMFLNDTSVAELFTLSPEGKSLVIQSVKPILQQKVFPVGLHISSSSMYKFVANLNDIKSGMSYILIDKLLNDSLDLSVDSVYAFQSGAITDNTGERFELLIGPKNTNNQVTSYINMPTDVNKIIIYSFDKQVFIKRCPLNAEIAIFDMLGNQLYISKANSDYEVIPCNFHQGCYIVRVSNPYIAKVQKVIL